MMDLKTHFFDTLELKKNKRTDYVFNLKSKGVYTSKLKPSYTYMLSCTA